MKTSLAVVAALVVCLCVCSLPAHAKFTCPSPGVPEFSCPTLTAPDPASDVRKLRPGNIGVTMALGDSITAGFGMLGVEPLEFRGDVYSTGGNKGAKTLYWYLHHYNSAVTGECTGVTIPLTKKGKGLNYAVSGAKVQDVPDQITRMTAALASDEYAHTKDEWKLLTYFIGANNICGACNAGRRDDSPEYFEEKLRETLQQIRSSIPKVFVNLVPIFNISQVWDAAQGNLYCQNAVPLLQECGCLNANATQRQLMDEATQRFNAATDKVAAETQALNDPQFLAVSQPGLADLFFADSPDAEAFLSDVDCFHPSLCADQAFSVALWNNMFQPQGSKSRTMDLNNPPHQHCPTDNEFLQ